LHRWRELYTSFLKLRNAAFFCKNGWFAPETDVKHAPKVATTTPELGMADLQVLFYA
jgi:hypothetical protein